MVKTRGGVIQREADDGGLKWQEKKRAGGGEQRINSVAEERGANMEDQRMDSVQQQD